jgi:STE24 endopeptidase
VSAVPFAVLLVTLVLGSGAWVAGRLARGRVPAPAVTAIAGCGATVAAVALRVDAWLTAAVAGVVGSGEAAVTVATALLFLGPVPVAAAAAHRGAGGRLRTFARGYVLLVGPALAALATAPLFPDGWWLVATVGGLGALVACGAPLVVPRAVGARALTAGERARIAPDARIPVRVLASARPNALAAGLVPGLRAVYVTEGLLARLPPDEAAAVVAHELGHHHRGHVALRVGAVAAFVLPWLGATAAAIPGAFAAGALLAGPYALGLVRLMRWTEHDADAYAAHRADGAALARGLRRLDGGRPRGRLRRLVSPHPAPGERARHLAERRRRTTGPP